MQYLREPAGITLRQLADELNTDDSVWGGVTNEMRVNREGDRLSLAFGPHEVPMTRDALEQVSTFVDAPRAFMLKQKPSLQETILTELLRDNAANVSLRYTEGGVSEIYRPERVRLEPRQLVMSAIKVVGEESDLVEWHVDPDEVVFDTMVPLDYDRGIGGDRAVGDISRGGVRVFQDRKNNHAPTVNSYLYRLACTNGMVVPETGLTLDARGSSVEMMLAEFELAAEHAFSQVERQIEHFYALRQQPIEGDITQTVIRVAAERGLSDRMGMTLARRVPDQLNAELLGHAPTMFDLINLFTNQANEAGTRPGTRRQLESAGGRLVTEQHDRCTSCYQQVG